MMKQSTSRLLNLIAWMLSEVTWDNISDNWSICILFQACTYLSRLDYNYSQFAVPVTLFSADNFNSAKWARTNIIPALISIISKVPSNSAVWHVVNQSLLWVSTSDFVSTWTFPWWNVIGDAYDVFCWCPKQLLGSSLQHQHHFSTGTSIAEKANSDAYTRFVLSSATHCDLKGELDWRRSMLEWGQFMLNH